MAIEIATERVRIPVDGASMPGYLARPAARGPHPAVIVWMEIFGINSHIRDVTERVAREGYVVLAPNFFHRTAPDIEVGYDEAGMAAGLAELGKLKADQMIADARAALAFLRARPDVRGDRIGATGFCIGGHMTYLTAAETDVAAAASFYGGGIAAPQGPGGGPSPIQRTAKIRGRILCLFGGKDALIPQPQVDVIRKALAAAGTRSEVVVYPDADHGFFCDQRAVPRGVGEGCLGAGEAAVRGGAEVAVRRLRTSLALVAGLLAACAQGPYPVEVGRGIRPRLTAAEVERIAQEQGAELIVEMRCVYYDSLMQMTDNAGSVLNHQPVWIVSSRGRFANPRYPGVAYDDMSWVIDDATGNVLGASSSSGRRAAPATPRP